LAAGFKKDLEACVALIPVQRPKGGEQPLLIQPRRVTGKVKGRMVVVNVNDRSLDDLHFALPNDLSASRPDEVGTVVLLTWEKRKVSGDGPISGRFSAQYQMIVQVKVFDWESKAAIAGNLFFGRMPGGGFRSLQDSVTGPKPDNAQLLTFLTGLPRQ
jgi:hypothetical protein